MYFHNLLVQSRSEPVVTSTVLFWLRQFGISLSPLKLGRSGIGQTLVGTENCDAENAANSNDETASRNELIIIISW